MRNSISIESAENYVDIFNSFESKFEEHRLEYNTENGIIEVENIVNKTNIFVDENFLKNSSSDSFGSVEHQSLRLKGWEEISDSVDVLSEAIYSYSNDLVPTFESGYYDTLLDREIAVETLSKVVLNTISLYTNGSGDYNSFVSIGDESKDQNTGFNKQQQFYNSMLYDVVGGLESYGTGHQNFSFDMRSAIMISASNYLTSIEDKLFARLSTPKAKIEYEIENIVKYDWGKGRSKVTTGPNARGDDTPISYVQLNKDPSSITTKSRPVEFHNTTTTTGLYDDGKFIKINEPMNIFDAVRAGVPDDDTVYQAFGESDTLSDGVKIKTIYLKIGTSATISRLHKIDVSYRDDCYFTKAENISEGADRVLNMNLKGIPVINEDAIDDHKEGATNPLATLDAGSHISLNCQISGTINLRTSNLEITSNPATYKIRLNASGKESTVAADATLKGLIDAAAGTIEVVACEIDAQYTEENIRKSNVAIRRNKVTKTARVPHGRTYIFETQALPKQRNLVDLITNAKNIIGLGNLYKLTTVWKDFIVNVGKAFKRDAYRNDYSAYSNFVSNFVTHDVILPSIETLDIDFNVGASGIVSKRDHELTEDTFGMFVRVMNSFINKIMADSCYPSVLNPGEKFRFVALTHFSVVNTLLTPTLTNDTKQTFIRKSGNGVVILTLADNIEIEFHSVCTDEFEKTVLAAPVRAGNRSHASSFGHILDVGTYSGSYTTGDSAVSEKHIVNSREGFYITSPVAFMLNLKNFNSVYPSQ